MTMVKGEKMYIVTGAAGFIGSCVAAAMIKDGMTPLVIVDDFDRPTKQANWEQLAFAQRVERDVFFEWVLGQEREIAAVVHLGARTDTTEKGTEIFDRLNVTYSQRMWELCTQYSIPLVYASSAATYGGGEHGFSDDHPLIAQLHPLNPYGESKHTFDKWVLAQETQPPHWAGLKFFNVYGPNEYHKGRMASVILHAYRQISAEGYLKLFRSHRPDFEDGAQLRDFVYVMDVVRVILFLLRHQPGSAIYNLGTGQARSFLDLGKAVFKALGREPVIEFVDTPADIRDTYQYFTEADMGKLLAAGYAGGFVSLEEGVEDYVQNYLMRGAYAR
jgi:ADP-L-glycero-D-manno-heptose 6-epimerase